MLPMALNHMTVPTLSAQDVLGLAAAVGCVGVEFRNDLNRPLFEGTSAHHIKDLATDLQIDILALAEVKAFNDAPETKVAAAKNLMETAQACGAHGVALIPAVASGIVDRNQQRDALRNALNIFQPMLTDMNLIGFIEPLGFETSTLRHKDDVALVLAEMGNPTCFKIVHDTFHHHLSGDTAFHANLTGLVHISGITDPIPKTQDMTDTHRVLVDAEDRLGNVIQLKALQSQGYAGPASFECFAPDIHAMTDPATALAKSIAFITSNLSAQAA